MDDTLPADYGSPGGTPSQLANLSSSSSLGPGYGASAADMAAANIAAANADIEKAKRQQNTSQVLAATMQGVAAATQAIQQSGVLPGTGKFVGSGRASPPAPPPAPSTDWKPWAFGAVAVLAVGGLAWWALKPEPVRSAA